MVEPCDLFRVRLKLPNVDKYRNQQPICNLQPSNLQTEVHLYVHYNNNKYLYTNLIRGCLSNTDNPTSLMFSSLLCVASSLILSFRYSLFLFLKCLLASCLTLFRLSPFIWLRSCNHCSLACFLQVLNILHRTMVYATLLHNNLVSLWLKCLYCLN
jgi:hypothetical protein